MRRWGAASPFPRGAARPRRHEALDPHRGAGGLGWLAVYLRDHSPSAPGRRRPPQPRPPCGQQWLAYRDRYPSPGDRRHRTAAGSGRLPDAAFLEFGWGDRTYYPAKKKTLGMALGAALTATPAVMHMAGLAVPPRQAGGGAEVLRVTLSETGFRRLVRASPISSNGPPAGRTAPISRGLYPDQQLLQRRRHLLSVQHLQYLDGARAARRRAKALARRIITATA